MTASTGRSVATTRGRIASLEWGDIRTEVCRWAHELATDPLTSEERWTYFLTLTWRKPLPLHHATSAGRLLTRWLQGWRESRSARKPASSQKTTRCLLWSAEGASTTHVHAHALLVSTPGVFNWHCKRCERASKLSPEWRRLKESWYCHYGIARIEPYKPALRFGAERYVLKYILSESVLDWGVVGGYPA